MHSLIKIHNGKGLIIIQNNTKMSIHEQLQFFLSTHNIMFWLRNKKQIFSLGARCSKLKSCQAASPMFILLTSCSNQFVFVWFDSLRPINNFSVIKGRVIQGWTSTKLGLMCLAQGHNTVTPVRLESAAPLSRVKHSTLSHCKSEIQRESDPDQIRRLHLTSDKAISDLEHILFCWFWCFMSTSTIF